jgi:diadenylate cyclase
MSAALNRILATFSVMEFQQYIEIAILIFLVYKVFIWFKDTKTSALIKGILIITLFVFLVQILNFKVISYLITSALPVVAVALVVLFQNELKMIILKLGDRNVFTRLISQLQGGSGSRTDDYLVNELTKAAFSMSDVKTGALIVVRGADPLNDFISTGILIDARVSSQLLINIFEKNTPLHDGAVIIENNRIVSATCYLPLTENLRIPKNLGTRHRAAIGLSEIVDALVLVVSEETGNVSIVVDGNITRVTTENECASALHKFFDKDKIEIDDNSAAGKLRTLLTKLKSNKLIKK